MEVSRFIIDLLAGESVEYKPLSEVFDLRNGYTPSKANPEYWENGDIPWFRMEDLRTNGNVLSDSIQHVHSSGIKGKLFKANSIIMATTATIGEHALITTEYMSNQQFTNFSVKSDFEQLLDMKFVYYYFFILDEQAKSSTNDSSFPSVKMNELRLFEFPIPPLHVQVEIVRILDNFTNLTTNLTTELNNELVARKQQYSYYRDKLLTFAPDKAEWKTLGEVVELIRGNGLQKKDFTQSGVPAIHYGQIYTHYNTFATETKSFVSPELAIKLKQAQYGDVLITGVSENIKDVLKPVGWLGGNIVFSGDMFTLRPSAELNTKYLTYMLQATVFQKYKEKYAHGAKVIRVRAEHFLKFTLPIPPLAEQQRIVDILNQFETLVNSITEGLPCEIKLRQQQYEYYRNLLLTFPK